MQRTRPEGTTRLATRRQPWGIVFGLARADLQHEWILTLCLIMAIAAVLSPLLLLFGLKYGTIETFSNRLIRDPRNRIVRPLTSRSFTREWFEELRQRPDVAFVVPTTRQISALVRAQVEGQDVSEQLNIIPTAVHDPLLLENGALIPGPEECVLTTFAAEKLAARIGDRLVITATRSKGGRLEAAKTVLRIVGIVSERASTLKAMYVQLEILEAVERYKDGEAVPEFDWPGTTRTAYPQYDGLLVLVPQALDPEEQFSLRNNTGFTNIERLTSEQLPTTARIAMAAERVIYLLTTRTKPVGELSVKSVRNKLRGKNATLLPWISPMPALLLDDTGAEVGSVDLYALSVALDEASELQLTPLPSWESSTTARQIMLPRGLSTAEQRLRLQVVNGQEALTFPVMPVAEHAAGNRVAFVPGRLAGILKLSAYRNVTYDPAVETFVLSRRGYAGFRMYAKTIYDVNGLRRYFADQGIPVHTEAGRIQDLIDGNRYLTLIFWLIAVVGIVGGVTALIASLYASVERKKRELGVLRLIGLSRAALSRYPVYQGVVIGICGYVVSMVFYQVIASLINALFHEHLQPGESFCRLPLPHAGAAVGATVLVAIVAASFAARRVMHIDPAEALRDE